MYKYKYTSVSVCISEEIYIYFSHKGDVVCSCRVLTAHTVFYVSVSAGSSQTADLPDGRSRRRPATLQPPPAPLQRGGPQASPLHRHRQRPGGEERLMEKKKRSGKFTSSSQVKLTFTMVALTYVNSEALTCH